MNKNLPLWARGLIFLALFGLLLLPIEQIIVNPYVSEISVVEQMIDDHENFDVLILGSSHSYCAFDPRIINTLLADTQVYNLSSANLGFAQISLLVEQIIEEGKTPEVLILEMFSFEQEMSAHSQIAYFNAYSKTWKPGYFGQILNFYSPDELLYPLFPIIYQHENWKLQGMMNTNVLNIWSKETLTAKEVYANPGSHKEGFRPHAGVLSNEEYQNLISSPKELTPTNTNLNGFEKLLILSKEYDIQLIFVMTPYPTAFTANNSFVDNLQEKYEIVIHDFNNNSIDTFSHLLFVDDDHLNSLGAIDSSFQLADIIVNETTRVYQKELPPYQHLNLAEITIEEMEGRIQVSLVPELPPEEWDVEWHLYDAEKQLLREQGSSSLVFNFPSTLMSLPGLFLKITYKEIGLDYPVTLTLSLTNE